MLWQPRPGTALRLAWGRYAQGQPLYALPVGDGVSRFAPAERAVQHVLGVEQQLPGGVHARVEAYSRRLTSVWPQFVVAGPAGTAFPELSWGRVRLDPTAARARGVECFVSREGGTHADWSATYALASAVDVVGGREVPRADDQRHALRLDWSWRPATNRWRLSLAGTWHSGWPATPPVLAALDTLANTPQRFAVAPVWAPGAPNAARLPAYRRVDARWTWYAPTRRGRVSVFAEVFNVFGAENALAYAPRLRLDGRTAAPVLGTSSQLPRIPAVGAAWEF